MGGWLTDFLTGVNALGGRSQTITVPFYQLRQRDAPCLWLAATNRGKFIVTAKQKLKELTSRSQGRNVRVVMNNVKKFIRGWLGYFWIASMKTTMQRWDEWLRRRFRMYIWKQWKKPKTRVANLIKLGLPEWAAHNYGNSRKGYWRLAGTTTLNRAISKERLAQAGYYSILDRYESLHSCG